MDLLVSNLMAENSTSMFAMYGEGLILFLMLTLVTFSYLLYERKHFSKIWNKCKSLIIKCKICKKIIPNFPRRLSLLKLSQWQYRGEGNEYLAISLPEQRKILRLRKSTCPNGFIANIKDWYNQHISTNFEEENKAAYFEKIKLEYYKVLVNLIGECYVQPSEEILLIRSEINKVNKIISSNRPEHRKKKRITYSCGSLLTDYAYLPVDWEISQFTGPTFAIEIKPKQGWIPESERVFQLCTYCLNQYIKLQNCEISAISEYCPMDLFSGQPSRMKYAIECLLKTPQNNLKIFQDGILVHGENNEKNLKNVMFELFNGMAIEKSVNEFCDLVTKALLKQLYTSNNHECSISTHNTLNFVYNENNINRRLKICNLKRGDLPHGSVLDRILNLQEYDVWGAEKVFAHLKQQSETYQDNKYNHASGVITRSKNLQHHYCTKCFFRENDSIQNIDTIIQKYIMSAIAKDCSVMLTFRKLKNSINIPNENIIETGQGLYAFKIGVFDLYPKPLSCVLKHVRKRHKFFEIYNKITNHDFI